MMPEPDTGTPLSAVSACAAEGIELLGARADHRFMGLAIAQAREAARLGEVPIGAVTSATDV